MTRSQVETALEQLLPVIRKAVAAQRVATVVDVVILQDAAEGLTEYLKTLDFLDSIRAPMREPAA